MKDQNFGRIINVSSVHGLRASEYKSAYVTAKHGVIGLTKVLALEGAEFNVTCNAICPGYVKTPLVEGQIKDQAKSHNMSEEEVVEKVMLKKQAVKSFVPIEKLGEIAVFLAAENATTVSGTTFTLDGAWSAQ
jgi:3-hydroxybutyrate dehydrogenase